VTPVAVIDKAVQDAACTNKRLYAMPGAAARSHEGCLLSWWTWHFAYLADNPLAFDAFLSILFAPQASAGSFDDMLRSIQRHGLPMLLVYGREDPWVRTIWGQRIVRIVPQATFYQVVDPASRHVRTSVTHATEFSTDLLRLFRPLSVRRFCEPVLVYHLHMSGPVSPSGETQIMLPMPLCRLDTHLRCALQVSPAGHCPQAEAPDLVARCLRAWIQLNSDGAEPLLQVCNV
jgi:pimeloyl-ACP methyl ester carboxylesterase